MNEKEIFEKCIGYNSVHSIKETMKLKNEQFLKQLEELQEMHCTRRSGEIGCSHCEYLMVMISGLYSVLKRR